MGKQKLSSMLSVFTLGWSVISWASTATNLPVVEINKMDFSERSEKLVYPARVESRVNSSVTAEAEGWVKKIKKPIGSPVKRGEVVLVLENQDPVYTYASIPVRAPADGFISCLDISLSSKITKGQKLFSVTDPKSLKIVAEIPESDVSSLQLGDRGIFKVRFDSKEEFPIGVAGISPLVDPQSGTARAEFDFVQNAKVGTVPAGILGQVAFETKPRKVFMVPESALTYKEGKPFVRLLVSGKMKRQPVELGPQTNDLYEVKTGLNVGDEVIVRANKSVKEGQEVSVDTATKAN